MRHLVYVCLWLPLSACECSVSFGAGVSDPPQVPSPLAAAEPLQPSAAAPAEQPVATPRGSRITGGPASVRGDLPAKKVSEIITRHQNELRFCHESQPSAPDQAQIRLKFIVNPQGAVQTASIDQSDADSERLERCLAETARRWTFPAPKGGGIVVVEYPLQLARVD